MVVILITILHVLVCFFLVVVVLLQSGKAADLAGAFGGMGSQTAFGPRGSATVLSKATTIAAGVFMITSLSLSVMATRAGRTGSTVLEKHAPALPKTPQPVQQPGSVPISIQTPGGGATVAIPVPPAESQPAPAQKAPAEQKAPAKK
ncbi:MAG: preprotein translocase subunit SecG [Acidobacteria bacterium]|nr:preprotein translocase subunit SecG [Acidobacteriota bacterium]